TVVKCYQRKKSRQYLITLKGEHGFKGDDPVVVLHEKAFKDLEDIGVSREKQILDLELQLKDKARDHEKELFLKDGIISQLESDREDLKSKNLQLEKDLKATREEIREHRLRILELEKLELEDYQGLYNKLRNKHDHLQERFNKSLEEVNGLQRIISDLSNRGFIDYITGRLPESYKQLSEPKKAT
ncbi:MAG TPA: hypothetical protein PKI66_06165, partial [Methanobacteriaceae archaeon]|nr:hypothetical protein [Methanobacteriaceae archaeon]